MTEQELFNEYRKSNCKSFSDFLINKIAELEAIVRNTKAVDERFAKLQQENAELKLKLEALEGQTPWKDIKDRSELIKENAELKADNDARKFAMAMSEKVEKQLREEIEGLKNTVEHYRNEREFFIGEVEK
jgi:hypothetical protein